MLQEFSFSEYSNMIVCCWLQREHESERISPFLLNLHRLLLLHHRFRLQREFIVRALTTNVFESPGFITFLLNR